MPDVTMQVLAERLDNLREDVARLRGDLVVREATYVPRGEYDARISGLGREVGDLKLTVERNRVAAESRHAPWWAVGALVVTAIGVLATFVMAIAG